MVDKSCIKFRVNTCDIAFLVQIMEGYDHVGVVTTTDPKTGNVLLQVTPDTYKDASIIIQNLPIQVLLPPPGTDC